MWKTKNKNKNSDHTQLFFYITVHRLKAYICLKKMMAKNNKIIINFALQNTQHENVY